MPKSPKQPSQPKEPKMDDLMTIAEAADALGKSTRTIRRYVEERVLPAFIAGKRGLMIRSSDVAGLLRPYVPKATA